MELPSKIFCILIISMCLGACSSSDHPKGKTITQAGIASAHPEASRAGMEILEQGGNAFDAAIATAAALAVVEPYSSGMGGGGFWLLHDANEQKNIFVDAREKAPIAAHRDMYLDSNGNVIPNLSINGPMSAAIPGQAAAFVHVAKNYGQLPLKQSLAPAIRLAKNGFKVEKKFQLMTGYRYKALLAYPSTANIFLTESNGIPDAGALIKQPELATTLEAIADKGFDGFYKGAIAQGLINDVKNNGGIWTLKDLADYRVVEREPVISLYKDYKIVSAPPPSSGGIAIVEMLNMLEHYSWETMSAAEQTHLITEVMRRAYRDRAEYLGDTDFVDVPVERLVSEPYAKKLVSNIDLSKATPSSTLGDPVQISEGFHTTHFSVIDKNGNRVSATLSINLPFGSAFLAEKSGVLLNNEMDDFSAKPGVPNAYGLVGNEANAIAPGKRPLSSMSPSFVESDDSIAIIGTPGGSRIISMVMLGILQHLQNKPVEDWVSLPRYHHQYLPDVIQHEPDAFNAETIKSLQEKGHQLKAMNRTYGNMHVVLLDKTTGTVTAASDPRGLGEAIVK